jgi:hypothetical protein
MFGSLEPMQYRAPGAQHIEDTDDSILQPEQESATNQLAKQLAPPTSAFQIER